MIEVWVAPAQKLSELLLGGSLTAELRRRLKEHQTQEIERMHDDTRYFKAQRDSVCQEDPRDFFEFRSAFHKGYDEFLAEAKRAHSRICSVDNPESFLRLMEERQKLAGSVCELDYIEYDLTLAQVKPSHWRSKAFENRSSRRPDCYTPKQIDLVCKNPAGCHIKLVMGLHSTSRTALFYRFRQPSELSACKDLPPQETIELDAATPKRKPA